MKSLFDTHDLVLMEAGVVERLRRDGVSNLHPRLVHANFVADEAGKSALARIYQSYIEVAREASLPLLLCAPTWRANRQRVFEADVHFDLNSEAVSFMTALRAAQGPMAHSIKIGGVIGCKNDCYRPEEALAAGDAEEFHSWQVGQLAEAGVDFLLAATLPDVGEAIGIAKALSTTRLPSIISFVIDQQGCVLDGTPLWDAVSAVDEATSPEPFGFMIGCSHPSFLNPAQQPALLFTRLVGYQANASSMCHANLDDQAQLQADDVGEWAREMLVLNKQYGVKILGGCCGTGVEHLERLVALRAEVKNRRDH